MKKIELGNSEVFARNLLRYIRGADKTQAEVAKAIGVHPASMSDWLTGRTYPRMDKIQLLAEYFGIQKSDLVEDEYVKKETISEQDQDILDLFHKVPEEKREFVLSMIRVAIETL